jgi:hypothetical protein
MHKNDTVSRRRCWSIHLAWKKSPAIHHPTWRKLCGIPLFWFAGGTSSCGSSYGGGGGEGGRGRTTVRSGRQPRASPPGGRVGAATPLAGGSREVRETPVL